MIHTKCNSYNNKGFGSLTVKEKRDYIQNMILNASGLELELVWIPKIISNQTIEEKTDKQAKYRNRKGLTLFDAKYITKIYYYIRSGNHLNESMILKVRNRLKKYWKQYLEQMSNS